MFHKYFWRPFYLAFASKRSSCSQHVKTLETSMHIFFYRIICSTETGTVWLPRHHVSMTVWLITNTTQCTWLSGKTTKPSASFKVLFVLPIWFPHISATNYPISPVPCLSGWWTIVVVDSMEYPRIVIDETYRWTSPISNCVSNNRGLPVQIRRLPEHRTKRSTTCHVRTSVPFLSYYFCGFA